MAHQRRDQRAQHHPHHRRWLVVLVVLASILSCDPTGNLNPPTSGGGGGGIGDPDDIDPQMIGSWRNIHLEGEHGDPDIKRVTTTWYFSGAASCTRFTESYSLAEDLTYTALRRCQWLADGRLLVVLYEGAPDTVNYAYRFPTMRHDTLEIGGIRFANVGP